MKCNISRFHIGHSNGTSTFPTGSAPSRLDPVFVSSWFRVCRGKLGRKLLRFIVELFGTGRRVAGELVGKVWKIALVVIVTERDV